MAQTQRKQRTNRVGKALSSFNAVPKIPALIILALVVTGIFASWLSPYSPTEHELSAKLQPPFWVEGGSTKHLLGTDRFGRDLLSRLIYASRVSITLSFLAVVIGGTIGTVVGLISAYFGGLVDQALMRLVDIGLSLPLVLVAIVVAAILGASYQNVLLVIAVLIWPRYARQIRGEALSLMQQDFVALARVAGCSHLRIVFRHIFPNVIPTLLVLATLQVGYVIMLESSLSFLGVGIPPPTPAWGVMVSEGKDILVSGWWISVFPGIAILLTVLAFNLMGDWVRDRLDPKLRQI